MKHFPSIKPLLIVLALIPLLATCNDDDDTTGTQNSIKIDGTSFKAVMPTLIGVSSDNEGHASFVFTNADFKNLKSLTIDFEYSGGGLVAGKYAFPDNGTDGLLNDWLTEYTVFGEQVESFAPLAAGTVTIKHHGGETYTVIMDLTMEDGTVIKGNYRGDFATQFQDN